MRYTLLLICITTWQNIFSQAPCRAQGGMSTGSWTPLTDMTESRNGHTASMMVNGNILVTGGYDGTFNLSSAEIYDPATDTWTPTGFMDSVRYQHTSTALDNGKVIIAGGWDGGTHNFKGSQIYDPATGLFTAGPFMTVGRSGHTATKMNDGRVLFVGGYSNEYGNTNVTDIYDPISNTITEAAPLHFGRSYHAAALLGDGRVLLAGGFNPDFGFQMNSVEIYDPVANTWTDAASLTNMRDYCGAAYISDVNKVLVAGGRYFNGFGYEGMKSAELYDIASNTWSDAADIPQGESYIQLFAFYYSNKAPISCVLLPGGTDHSGVGVDLTFSSTYAYDVWANNWTEQPMLFNERYAYAGTSSMLEVFVGDPKVYVTGGQDKAVEVFIPATYGAVENTNPEPVTLFPNPAENEIQFSLPEGNFADAYFIYNATGELIMQSGSLQHIPEMQLNIDGLENGIYSIMIHTENDKAFSGSFIKL